MNYIGFDVSSKAIHAAFINKNEKLIALRKWGSKEKDSDDRLYEIIAKFENDINSELFDNIKVTIEKALFIQNFKTSLSIAKVISGVQITLNNKGKKNIVIVENTKWKREIGIGGNAKKEKIKEWAIQKFGIENNLEQDYYDACGIALFCKGFYENTRK